MADSEKNQSGFRLLGQLKGHPVFLINILHVSNYLYINGRPGCPGAPDLDYMAIGLATELAMEINRFQDIRVLVRGPEDRGRREVDTGARFAIDGSIRKDPAVIKVAVQLIDLASNIQIWEDMHKSDREASRIIAFQEHVARMIAAKICGELEIGDVRAESALHKNTTMTI